MMKNFKHTIALLQVFKMISQMKDGNNKMRTAVTPYSLKFKLLKFFASTRRLLLSRRSVRTGQLLLAAVQLIVLGYLLEWIVSSLIHFPLDVSVFALFLIALPIFMICWPLLRYFDER